MGRKDIQNLSKLGKTLRKISHLRAYAEDQR